jgi:rfaE bifunctional protein kinase chain/domain
MKYAQLTQERLGELADRFSAARIAVLGDFFLDKYLDVDPAFEEISVETGKPAHQVVSIRCSPGAAGTVTSNLAALGAAELHAIGFTGDDGEGFDLRKALAALGCSTQHLHTVPGRSTPTYLKPRDLGVASLAAEHSRYDTKNRCATPENVSARLIESLDALLSQVHAVVVLDQVEEHNCGVVTSAVRAALADRARQHADTIFWADSRRRIHEFEAMIVKPNQFEAVGRAMPLPGDKVNIEELQVAARRLREKNRAPVVVTLGAQGMMVSDPQLTLARSVTVQGEIDPTGAGDSATAGAVLALCAGASLPEAAVVGNLVASITIQQIGTTGVASPAELAPRLTLWHQQNKETS